MDSYTLPLWDDQPPGALGDAAQDRPFMQIFLPSLEKRTGAAMLIFPGGAYTFLSEKSGAQYARWLAAAGICGAVVNFRLGSHGYHYPALLADAQQAFAVVINQAKTLHIDPQRIGVIGTSAGGHLASLLLTGAACENADETSFTKARPALGVLCYPVITLCDPLAHHETRRNFLGDAWGQSELQRQFSADRRVAAGMAPVFIWHTNTDTEVPAQHSLLFTERARAAGVPYEMHLYGSGGHALGLAEEEGLQWSSDCIRWLRGYSF